jgi:hypothetical protein
MPPTEHLKMVKIKLDVVVLTCNPSTWEAEAAGS